MVETLEKLHSTNLLLKPLLPKREREYASIFEIQIKKQQPIKFQITKALCQTCT